MLSGVTVGGNALGGSPVSERVLAYPQAKSGLVDWAKAMKRHDVAPSWLSTRGMGLSLRYAAFCLNNLST